MIGIIQKIEDGKAYIQTDDGQLIIIPIADVDYVNPHVDDQVFLIRQEDHWKVIRRSGNIRRKSKRIPILMCTIVAAVVLLVILLVCNNTNKDIHSKTYSDTSSALSIVDTKSAGTAESSNKSASLGENILVKAKQGQLEVTLDSVHWSGWSGPDWSDKIPDGSDILLVEMTIKDDGWNDEDNPNTFTYADSGFSVLDEEGATLSESEYYDDDGLYQRDPDMEKGQTVRAFVPLFAKKNTKKVTVVFTDGTSIKIDVKGNAAKLSESTDEVQSFAQDVQKKEENTVNIDIYSSFNVKKYVQEHLLSSKSNNFKISTNADGYDEKTGKLDTSVSGAKIFTISLEDNKDITLRVNISDTVHITPENPNPIMYRDDKLEIAASHFTTDNTGLDMYHFFFNVTNNTGNDINLFVTSFSIDDKSYDSIWGSMPNHQGKSVADLGAGSPSEVHQWGLDNFDKIKFTLQIDGYTGHDMLTVKGTVSHDMFQ